METLYYILASVPIISLITLSLIIGVKKAAVISFVITIILFFSWGAGFNTFSASLISSLISAINILLIVTGAIFLYDVMKNSGLVGRISNSLTGIHPSKEIRFFLLAISLTAFFEGVAGFGTPGAIVPLLLMSLGYSAILSISVVLLFDGLFVVFGAVGIPVTAGLINPLNLSVDEAAFIQQYSAFIIASTGYLILWFICRLYEKFHSKMEHKGKIFLLYTFFAVPLIILSFFTVELATILSAIVMLTASIIYLYDGKEKISLTPWLPYGGLILLMLLPKFIQPLNHLISSSFVFENIFETGIASTINILQSPLIPFVITGTLTLLFTKTSMPDLKILGNRLGGVFIILFPAIAISQMMLHSGVSQPSMINYMAGMFSTLGKAYIMFASFIGIAGTFITGSTTVSNIIFGPAQYETAGALGINKSLVLTLQHCGAAIGNAICLFNIIAAATVVNLKTYKEILSNNIVPVLAVGLIIGMIGMILNFFI